MFCLLLAATVRADTQDADDILTSQRKDFQAAEQALSSGKMKRYRQIKASLKDYPLYPYLEYRELRQQLRTVASEPVEYFLTRYPDTPLADLLRSAWLNLLVKRRNWRTYLVFYRPNSGVKRQCHYLNALIETGRKAEALEQVERLWLHGRSRPKACDPVFEAWREAGRLTDTLVWKRIRLAMRAGQTRLARYLGRFLDEG
ncbi:MAG: murein transglycosylase, partial [Gammaproteobacteria bacterium]|nr:murein transglycosylase [Gammaproteobacteria bacterium]